MHRVHKIKLDPSKSIVADIDFGALALDHNKLIDTKMTKQNIWTLIALAVGMGFLIWGVLEKGWYFDELCGLLLITGIVCGIIRHF